MIQIKKPIKEYTALKEDLKNWFNAMLKINNTKEIKQSGPFVLENMFIKFMKDNDWMELNFSKTNIERLKQDIKDLQGAIK